MNHRRRAVALGSLAFATLTLGGATLWLTLPWQGRSYAAVPPDQSEFLRGVAEPISMAWAISWDDGGSNGLIFKDFEGQGVPRLPDE